MAVSSRPSALTEAVWPPGSLLAHDEAAVLERGRRSLLDEYLRGIKETEWAAANSAAEELRCSGHITRRGCWLSERCHISCQDEMSLGVSA